MILPPRPRSTIVPATAWRVKNRPLTLTANWLSKLSSVTSRTGAMSKMAALLTRMSMPPPRPTTCATMAVDAIRAW